MRIVALIPARAGSKRIPGKNTKLLGGKPLIQWTIDAALAADIFTEIYVSTDCQHTADMVGGFAWIRPAELAGDDSPDIHWVKHVLDNIKWEPDAFAILRPTSPFRTADTIVRAVGHFQTTKCSSIRAVERVKQHPGKMWLRQQDDIAPLIEGAWRYRDGAPFYPTGAPWHSLPTQSLPEVFVQNSSLEIAHRWCVDIFGTISGPKVAPFFTEGYEGFALDYPEDWDRAEQIVAALQAPPPA